MPAAQMYVVTVYRVLANRNTQLGYYGVGARNADEAESLVRADLEKHMGDEGYAVKPDATKLWVNAEADERAAAYRL